MQRLLLGLCVTVVVAAACSTGFDVDQPGGSFDTTDGGVPSAAGEGPCDPRATFLSAVPLGASTAGVFDGPPSLTRDELTMAWERQTALLTANRAVTSANFPAGSPLGFPPGSSPALSPDGGVIIFTQTVDGGLDLYVGNPPVALAALNTTGTERGASFSADGTKLFFSSSRLGPFAIDEDADSLFVATLGADGGFDNPAALTDATTNSKLAIGYNPTPSADGKNVYFARRQADGTDHIFVADFDGAALTNLTPVVAIDTVEFGNPATNQFPGMISSDQCRLYFASDATGDSDLYVASRR